jgi:hypothetical protein
VSKGGPSAGVEFEDDDDDTEVATTSGSKGTNLG